MKSTRKDKEEKKEKDFPKLMIWSRTGCVLLMTKQNCGVVISKGTDTEYPVGSYSDTWAPGYLTDYTGTIELSND